MAITASHQPAHFGEPSFFVPRTVLLFLSLATTLPPSTPKPIPAKGFSLELIHRDSPRSPLYIANLTGVQRLQRSLGLNDDTNAMISPSLFSFENRCQYLVNVTLSPGNQSNFLIFDTGSELIWTKCKPCDGCPQLQVDYHPFDTDQSPFYHLLPCSHPHCRRPPFDCTPNNVCNYTMVYGDQETTARGYLSSDFSFMHDGMVAIRITFGCTHNLKNGEVDGYPEGIFGMSEGPLSFPSQLWAIGGISRFTHCFPRSAPHSFLRFGDDILMNRPFQRIPFGHTSTNARLYCLDLLDISIDNERLNIEAGAFVCDPRLEGDGSFHIDSGSVFSTLIGPVYDRVMSVLVAYFDFFHLKRVANPPGVKRGLCYKLRDGTEDKWPTMTLHFREADLLLTSESLFIQLDGKFCWAILRHERRSFLGEFQQRDIRFVFDLQKRELLFAQEDCSLTG